MSTKKEKRINDEIIAKEVFVISDEGEKLGKMTRDAALTLAEEEDKDLVEMWLQDGIVLTKIMDYGKYLFKQQKQQSHNKNQSKKTDVKTLKLTYKIGDHDLEIRKNQAVRFAQDGHPLKIMLQLRGRENQYEQIAQEKIRDFITSLAHVYKQEANTKLLKQGTTFNITLYPIKK